jgi:predicted RNA-binding Zn-ribbon protein involved in translation (DUF1610 family)
MKRAHTNRRDLRTIRKAGGVVAGESITVACACGKKLKAPANSVGKKARCPACGNIIVLAAAGTTRPATPRATANPSAVARKTPAVAAVAARPAPSPAAVSADDDNFLNALNDLAEQEGTAPQPATQTTRCPKCKSAMADGAVLCTNCGFDTRSGKVLSYQSAKPAAKAGKRKPVDRMAPQGSFMAGLAMSAAFALAASVLWFVVAWLTGFAIGYVAIVIGLAAGVGMQIGQKGYSSAGGYTASGMTLGAILLAKLAVVELIILPIIQRHNPHASISTLNSAALGYYFFSPIGLIIMAVGMAAAFRTANGSVRS